MTGADPRGARRPPGDATPGEATDPDAAPSPDGSRSVGAGDPRLRPRPFTLALATDHVLFSLGLFSLMPVLPLLLAALQRGGTAFVGTDLFVYTASAGVGTLPLTRWLQRLPYAVTLSGGLWLAAVGFGALPYLRSPVGLFAVLFLAGLGYSVHFVYSRVLITELIADDLGRHRIYSVIQIAVNVSAALGPFVAVYLYASDRGGRTLAGAVAACYALAGLTMLARVPRRLRPPRATTGWAVSRATIAAVRRDRLTTRVVLSTAVGSFLYAQFYSAFTIMVGRQLPSTLLRAILLAVPATSIVVAQAGVSWLVGRSLMRGVHSSTVLVLATLVFGVAMTALGAGGPVVVDACLGVALFSCAEMLFTPTVSTAFAAVSIASRVEAFNLRQVSWTLGEAVGSWCGGSVFLFCLHRGHGSAYWLALGTATLVGMPVAVLATRGHPVAVEGA